MNNPVLDQVRQLVADVLNMPKEALNESSSPDEIASWDSMQHLNIVLAVEQQFDLTILPEEIETMVSVGRIAALIEEKVANTHA